MSCGGFGHSLFSEKNRKLARADLTVTKKNKYCAKHEQTHLVSSSQGFSQNRNNALISGHPGGLTPGTYGGIARGLLTFVANFWPGTGYIALYSKHMQAEETVCSLKLPFCDLQGIKL